MKIDHISKDDWATLAEKAHLISFGQHRPASKDRIDFALLAATDDGDPLGYMTCRENDSETVYLQFGGAFPPIEKSVKAYRTYLLGIEYLKERYTTLLTLIGADNIPMLKMAMRAGFRISGVRVHEGNILVEHTLK